MAFDCTVMMGVEDPKTQNFEVEPSLMMSPVASVGAGMVPTLSSLQSKAREVGEVKKHSKRIR